MRTLFFIGFFLLIFPLSAWAQIVRSENFVLTDAAGNMTAQLTTGGEGTPALFFYDAHNIPRISIGLYGDGVPGIVLNDEKWNAGAILRLVDNAGNPVLVLKENGQDKYIIDKNGVPAIPIASPSNLALLLIAFLWGMFWGFITFMAIVLPSTKAK